LADKKVTINQRILTGTRDLISVGGNSRGVTFPKLWFDIRELNGLLAPKGFIFIGHTQENIVMLVPAELEKEGIRTLRKLVKKLRGTKQEEVN